MLVTKEGIYRDDKGNELPVFNVFSKMGIESSYFRAYWMGGYYDVNKENDNAPGEIWEMVEFVRDFIIDENGFKS